MSFFNNIKKIFDSDDDKQKDFSPNEKGSDSRLNTKSFIDLDDLIHSGLNEIVLDSNYSFDSSKDSLYNLGIKLDIDGLIIDGNGFTIDADYKMNHFIVKGRDITLKNITFKNGKNTNGVASITVEENSSLNIIDCKFIGNLNHKAGGGAIVNCSELLVKDTLFMNNNALNGSSIFNDSNLSLDNCTFESNSSDEHGGALFNHNNGKMFLERCNFKNNNAIKGGGAIISFSELRIKNCNFESNKAKEAGAIMNLNNLMLEECNFENNSSHTFGGCISNSGDLTTIKNVFSNNSSPFGGVLNNHEKGLFNFSDCHFSINSSFVGGSIANNMGKGTVSGSTFLENVCLEELDTMDLGRSLFPSGSAIFNDGNMTVSNCHFEKNESRDGTICNFYHMAINEGTVFKNNFAIFGSAVYSVSSATLNCVDVEFSNNHAGKGTIHNLGEVNLKKSKFSNNSAYEDASNIFNVLDMKIVDCEFSDNDDENCNNILNEGSLNILNSDFHDIASKALLMNNEDAELFISGVKIYNNCLESSAIYNLGSSCNIDHVVFESNDNHGEYYKDICNETQLSLFDSVFKCSKNLKTVLNNGHMVIRIDDNDIIENYGTIDDRNSIVSERFSFYDLEELISKNSGTVLLEEDVFLENSEIDFYEGGIELVEDNLTIDGNGITIDANSNGRIFSILGKNITLKNITFKNGKLFSRFDKHTNGGGAIRIFKDASLSLKECRFINNYSEDDGGAILNNGVLSTEKVIFHENVSGSYGGVIYNKHVFNSSEDRFENNKSKMFDLICNYGESSIDKPKILDIDLSGLEPIFNNGKMFLTNFDDESETVLNIGMLNESRDGHQSESFSYLNNMLFESNEIYLEKNIVYDIEKDAEYIEGIEISKDNVLIEGNGFEIDGKKICRLFKICGENITFSNIVFKNFYSTDIPIIENNGSISFKNCKFDYIKTFNDACVILNNNLLIINQCSFSNSSLKDGNLIINNDRLEIHESQFINNYSNECIVLNENGNVDFDYSFFLDNGTKFLSMITNKLGKTNVSNSIFKYIYSRNQGGCIYNMGGKVEISICSFYDNFSFNGGVLSNKDEMNINDCVFIKNNANKGFGGAIFNEGKLHVCKSRFLDNIGENGGAIYNFSSVKSIIIESLFKQNKSKDKAGAILNVGNMLIEESIFRRNYSSLGGSIFNDSGAEININSTLFDLNNAKTPGSIVFSENSECNTSSDCKFIEDVSKLKLISSN